MVYFNKYIEYISNIYNYNMRFVFNNNIIILVCKRNFGFRMFYLSVCCLWNVFDFELKIFFYINFKNYLVKFYCSMIFFFDYFKICKIF